MAPETITILYSALPTRERERWEPILNRHRGRLLQNLEKEIAVIGFANAGEACGAALELRKAFPRWRAGLASGETKEATHLARLFESIALAGDIFFDATTRSVVDEKGVQIRNIGTRLLPGISTPVPLFAFGDADDRSAAQLFDFSRVEQERIQEATILSAGRPIQRDLESSIPLATESQPRERTSPGRTVTSPSYRPAPPRSALPKPLRTLLILGIGLPVLLIGGGWIYRTLNDLPHGPTRREMIDTELQSSEVMKSLEDAKRRAEEREAAFSAIVVVSHPTDVHVYLDGKLVADKTPVRIGHLPANEPLELRLFKEGYQEEVQLLSLAPGEKKRLDVRLKR